MAETEQTEKQISRGEYFPGWFGRIVIGGALIVVVAIRLLGNLESPPWPLGDSGVLNLLTLIFSFIALLTTWIWFCFISGYRLVARRVVMVVPIVLVGVFFAVFRLADVSGSMVPRFVPRWSAVPDRSLKQVESQMASE